MIRNPALVTLAASPAWGFTGLQRILPGPSGTCPDFSFCWGYRNKGCLLRVISHSGGCFSYLPLQALLVSCLLLARERQPSPLSYISHGINLWHTNSKKGLACAVSLIQSNSAQMAESCAGGHLHFQPVPPRPAPAHHQQDSPRPPMQAERQELPCSVPRLREPRASSHMPASPYYW